MGRSFQGQQGAQLITLPPGTTIVTITANTNPAWFWGRSVAEPDPPLPIDLPLLDDMASMLHIFPRSSALVIVTQAIRHAVWKQICWPFDEKASISDRMVTFQNKSTVHVVTMDKLYGRRGTRFDLILVDDTVALTTAHELLLLSMMRHELPDRQELWKGPLLP